MAQELRISVTIPLSDDVFEAAQKMVAAKAIIEGIQSALANADIEGVVSHDVVTPKPRAAKAAALDNLPAPIVDDIAAPPSEVAPEVAETPADVEDHPARHRRGKAA